jgi:putative two-component system response regulator
MESLRRLSRAVEYHDGATGAHIERVGEHTAAIARTLGLDEARIELLRVAAPLHDIGKIGVPATLLRKPEPLTDVERMLVQHHERWDGAGYPAESGKSFDPAMVEAFPR